MTIEIHQPEIETLIAQQIASGRFQDVEDVLLHALRSAPWPNAATEPGLVRADVTLNGSTGDVGPTVETNRPERRLKLDPPLIPPAGRILNLTNEQIYELIELP
jgi:hypothetical protein